jgi:hypothetical protein
MYQCGFQLFSNKQYLALQAVNDLPPRFVVRNYPCLTLYGTPGRREAYAVADGNEFLFEAKYQDGSGSVDEKLPFIWDSFLKSATKNLIAIFDGSHWSSERGVAAINYLRALANHQTPSERRMVVLVSREEVREFVKQTWGR